MPRRAELSRADPGSRAGARPVRHAAAVGLAVLDAASLQARPRIDGIRAINPEQLQPAGDAYDTGRGRLAAGDVTGALAAFRQALLDDPRSVDALNALGVCYDRLGRYDISRSYYDSALALAPGSAAVLNNLGYSLTLQGALAAAIPVLRQAADAGDPAAAANSQRLLTLVAARLRAAATEAQVAATRSEVAATRPDPAVPVARIEVAANGEQRLVIGGPAPSPALTASLGDAAPLVLVARPWTPRDEAAVAAREVIADRAAAAAAALAAPAAMAAAATPAAAPVDVAALVLDQADNAAGPAVRRDGPGPSLRLAAGAAPPRLANAGTVMPTAVALATPVTAAALDNAAPSLAIAAGPGDSAAPAWLLPARRDGRTAERRAATGQGPHADRDSTAFDSDDRALNSFAARMRGAAAPAAAEPAALDPAHAVARLEGLLARLAAPAGAA